MGSNFVANDAEGYELVMGRWSRELAEPFLAFAGIEGESRVLDVGCGTGSLTRAIAARHAAEVVGVDIAPPFVEHARARNRDPRVSFEVEDASELSFASGAFDAALSILVLNFIPEYRAAAAGMVRVTRPGGLVAAACWSLEGGSVMMRTFWDTAAGLDPAAAEARGRSFSSPLTRAGELADLFRGLGLHEVEETALTIWMRFASFEDYWTPFTRGQGTLGAYVDGLDDRRRERLRTALRETYCAGRADGPRAFAAIAHAAKGRVP
jgi:SAM-dependent methyltransferase